MFPLTLLELLATCGCTLTKGWALIGNALSMKQRDYYCSLVLWKRIVGREDSKSFRHDGRVQQMGEFKPGIFGVNFKLIAHYMVLALISQPPTNFKAFCCALPQPVLM